MSYNCYPETKVVNFKKSLSGSNAIVEELNKKLEQLPRNAIIVFECYPGTDNVDLYNKVISKLKVEKVVFSDDLAFDSSKVNSMISKQMTKDRVFGIMTHYNLKDFFPDLSDVRNEIRKLNKRIVIYGTGASILENHANLKIYCDISRWEIQLRYRNGLSNWRQDNEKADSLRKFKRGYFFEWRMADRVKKEILPSSEYVIDVNKKNDLKMILTDDLIKTIKEFGKHPYRTVPYFDTSVWGGQWMKKNFGLNKGKKNYGWAFDGVPEENSIYMRFGKMRFEMPAMNLMLFNACAILGEKVVARFGNEFPIRFDFLDTVKGGNLSLQVHPLTEYIKQHYGMSYTQDESYYILHATDNSSVYLGLKDNVNTNKLVQDFTNSVSEKVSFPVNKYINQFTAKKGDHFLIPAGTIHCGGKDTVILEVSATPYIFTFKMWDWGRAGLDNKPRPLHVQEGLENLQFNRDKQYVKKNLINNISVLKQNKHELVERTGLHSKLEFIETLLHTITDVGHFDNHGSVNMLNLVEGEKAIVSGNFMPYIVHFGETFIVPADVHSYVVKNENTSKPIKIIQAFVK